MIWIILGIPCGPCVDGSRSLQRFSEKSDANSRSLESNRCTIETSNDLIPNLIRNG